VKTGVKPQMGKKSPNIVRLYIRNASVEVPLPPLDDMALLEAGKAMVKDLIENWLEELEFAVAHKVHAMMQGKLRRTRFLVMCENTEKFAETIAEAIKESNYLTMRHYAA
jgi:hypothetical protein